MLITERVLAEAQIVESDRTKLPPGVLCRVKYPICNIDELNANKRIYGSNVWETVCSNSILKEQMSKRALFGHAEHPATSQSDLQLTSHVIFEMMIDPKAKKVYQMIDVVDTPTGRIVDTLLRAGCQVGVSTRAEGELQEDKDGKGNKFYRVVPEKYKYITTDFTADPSTFGTVPVEVKRNVVEGVKKEILNEKATDNEKKFATTLLESLQDKELKEDTVSLVVDPNQRTLNISGDVSTVNIEPSSDQEQTVAVTVTTPGPTPPAPPEKEEEYDMEGEMAREDLPPEAFKEPEEAPEEFEEEVEKEEEEEVEESKISEETKDTSDEKMAIEDATHYVLKRRSDKAAVEHLVKNYGMTEEKANEVLENAKNKLKEEMKDEGFDEWQQSAVDESKEIKAMYKAAGFPAPDGKGEHTKAFHELAIEVAKGYVKSGDSPKEALKKSYPTAMEQLGKKEAVKKSHQRNESTVSEAKMRRFKVKMDLEFGAESEYGTAEAIEKLIRDKFVHNLKEIHVYEQASNVKTEESGIITPLAKEITELKVKEASIRAERDKLMETVDGMANKDFELKIAVGKLKNLISEESEESTALRRKLEERVKVANGLRGQLAEAKASIDTLNKQIAGIKESAKSLAADHKARVERIKKDYEKTIKESVLNVQKDLIKQYVDNQLKVFGSVQDNVRALLEDCLTIHEVDRILDEYRETKRRSALHPTPIREATIVKEPTDQGRNIVGKRIRKVFEGFGMQ